MRHTATALLTATLLTLAGCSSGNSEPTKPASPTTTQPPTLSETEARQACVDAWLTLMTADGYDPDTDPETPTACNGLTGQADMYAEALRERNAENRGRLDECLEDPTCTEFPVG